jgi:polysaccharide biosynthesis transport protein
VVNIRAEKRDVQRGISAEIGRIAEKISSEYEVARSREAAVHKSLEEVTGQTGVDSRTAITLRELERTAEVNRKLYEEFLQKAKITHEQSTFATREARIITAATPPTSPSSPKKSQTMLIVAFFGLMCGIGGAFALEMLNAGFSTPRQVEDMLGMPVLASVSLMSNKELTVNGKVVPLLFYTAAKPLSRFSEAIRSLRSGIQMTDVDNPPKIIQVTSALPGEGKSSIAQCLAASAAGSSLKVLFIDADLRNPSSSRYFGLGKEAGLVELLLGQADARSVIRYYEPGRFWTLSAGGRTQNPPDLLGSERMRSLVTSFATSFDYVIIDTPPLGPVIDPVIVSQIAEKIVFVVRWSSTAREVVEQSIKKIAGDKKVAGIVLNQTDDARLRKYGQDAYSYYGTAYYDKYYSG